jgi:hypothetical protein
MRSTTAILRDAVENRYGRMAGREVTVAHVSIGSAAASPQQPLQPIFANELFACSIFIGKTMLVSPKVSPSGEFLRLQRTPGRHRVSFFFLAMRIKADVPVLKPMNRRRRNPVVSIGLARRHLVVYYRARYHRWTLLL